MVWADVLLSNVHLTLTLCVQAMRVVDNVLVEMGQKTGNVPLIIAQM